MSENPSDRHHLPPEHVPHPIRMEPGAHAQVDDMDAQGIILVGSFLTLLVVFLVVALTAYFHYYQYQIQDQRQADMGDWAAGIKAQQLADLQPHYVDSARTQATVGLDMAVQTVLADYTTVVTPPALAHGTKISTPSTPAPVSSTPVAAAPAASATPLHVLGQQLFQSVGCSACHTVDGSKGVGPSLKNVAGYPQELTNGKTVIADYAYLRYMILNPNKQVVKGFPPIMTDLSDQIMDPNDPKDTNLNAIIWYINSLSDKSSKATQPPIPDNPGSQ